MPNVYAVNKTESSLSVDSWFVYYINNSNAEIVEVEGTAIEPTLSVGDIITFGNYPQATSTPEPIEWKVLNVDTKNHKCLLIANKVLDCQKYNSENTNVTWETCSLRTWLNGTFLNTAFDNTEQGRIPLSHIENQSNPTYGTSGGNATDDKVFCLSIQEASNTSYFSDNDVRKCRVATQHAIDAGASISGGGYTWYLRSPGERNNYAAAVYDDGSIVSGLYVTYKNGIRPALWMDYSQTVRFKAFKYTFNGISYYYVIDGIHNFWTDDLSRIGYSEIPSVVLPTVSVKNDFGSYNWLYSQPGQTTYANVSAGDSREMYYSGLTVSFDSSKSYAVLKWFTTDITQEYTGTNGDFSVVNSRGHIAVKNDSGSTKSILQARVAVCSDSTATVVTVYDSSNNPFNAFKYTANNTDYYYVLDGTQTDWTDDLSSIGYHLPPVPASIISYVSSDKTSRKVSSSAGAFVYDDAGNIVLYQTDKTYTLLKFYDSAIDTQGTAISDITWTLVLESRAVSGENRLFLHATIPYSGSQWIQRIEYTVS